MLIDKLYLEDLLSIDKLHYKEVKIINDLHDALLSQDGDTASKKLKELVLDVEHHFSEEEKQMFKYNYEGGNKHQHAHGLALVQLYTARDEFNES
jgi:hemerythrin